jgi:hypothetical protein
MPPLQQHRDAVDPGLADQALHLITVLIFSLAAVSRARAVCSERGAGGVSAAEMEDGHLAAPSGYPRPGMQLLRSSPGC